MRSKRCNHLIAVEKEGDKTLLRVKQYTKEEILQNKIISPNLSHLKLQ